MKKFNAFVFGTQYYRPPTPTMEEWEEDLINIQHAGFDSIKIWMMWRWHARRRDTFEWQDTDELFRLCGKLGLKINVNFILDAAPDWVYDLHQCHRINHKGEKVNHIALGAVYIGGVTPCFDNPNVRKEAEKFIEAAVNRYKNNKILMGWDVWNEPRYLTISKVGNPGYADLECWCGHSIASYRNWLKENYNTVDHLNRSLGKAWSEWNTVLPPTRVDDYTEMLVWRRWCMDNITGQIRWAYDTVKKFDPHQPAFCHVGGCSVIQWAGSDPSDDYANAAAVDFYGSSLPCDENPWTAAMICDWMRAVSPYYWINEVYSSDPHWRNKITAEHLRVRTWTAIAHGAKGILYWQYKPERLGNESNGYGLVHMDGTSTGRLDEVASIAAKIQQYGDVLVKLKPVQADVGIIYDVNSDILSNIEKIAGAADYGYKEGIHGAYALLWRNNIPVDWIPSAAISLEYISKYKVVYLPVPLILDEVKPHILMQYIENGGVLISEASPGIRDAKGWVSREVPGHGLQHVFGCVETERHQFKDTHIMELELDGKHISFKTNQVIAKLSPREAAVIGKWEDGSCAATENRYGKGKAVLLGTYIGAAYKSLKDSSLINAWKELLMHSGMENSFQVEGSDCISVRTLAFDQTTVIAIINAGTDKKSVKIRHNRNEQWNPWLDSGGEYSYGEKELHVRIPGSQVMWFIKASSE